MKIKILTIVSVLILVTGCAENKISVNDEKVREIQIETKNELEKNPGQSREKVKKEILSKNPGYYSKDEIYKALNNLESDGRINWNNQAYKAASRYIDSEKGYSKKRLFWEMTKRDGSMFTEKEAKNAIDELTKEGKIDWNRQAYKAAKNLIKDNDSLTELGLKEKLVSEKHFAFTPNEASNAINYIKNENSQKKS